MGKATFGPLRLKPPAGAGQNDSVGCLNGLQAGYDVEYLVVLGETEGLELGEDQFAVHTNFKSAAASFDQGGYVIKLLFYGCLQTCSIRQVVSFAAVFNGNVHPWTSSKIVVDVQLKWSRNSSRFAA